MSDPIAPVDEGSAVSATARIAPSDKNFPSLIDNQIWPARSSRDRSNSTPPVCKGEQAIVPGSFPLVQDHSTRSLATSQAWHVTQAPLEGRSVFELGRRNGKARLDALGWSADAAAALVQVT